MASLRVIQSPAPPADMLDALKQYASVPDDGRDALLMRLLESTLLRVQEYADLALVECLAEQTCLVPADRYVRLYLGGGDVVSVKDADGEDIPFDAYGKGRIRLFRAPSAEVTVLFETKPSPADVARCMPTVLQYATALYDGETTEVLNTILNEVLC